MQKNSIPAGVWNSCGQRGEKLCEEVLSFAGGNSKEESVVQVIGSDKLRLEGYDEENDD
jgi:hypothetical protein